MNLSNVSDEQLIEKVKQLTAKERECTFEIICHFAELDRRRLYAELGYSSLFDYAKRALGYSRMSAQRRIVAARLVRNIPEAAGLFREKKLSLAVCELLKEDSPKELVLKVAGKSLEHARLIVAQHSPVPLHRLRDRVEPVVIGIPQSSAQTELFETDADSRTGVDDFQYRVSFTASPDLKRKLERAEKLIFGLSRDANIASVLEELADYYLFRCSPEERLKRRAQRKVKITEKVKRDLLEVAKEVKRKSDASRDVPVALKDELLEKAGYRCSYVSPDGTRCNCEVHLEADHIVPWAKGGKTAADNLRILCKTHNLMFARKSFGEEFMKRWM